MRVVLVMLALACTSATASIATTVATAAPARAVTSDVQDYIGRINQLRTSRGLNSLAVDANIAQLAQNHTQQMAATLSMVHTADLRAGVTTPYIKLGENVGYGSSTDLLWNAFLASPSHMENLLDPAFTHVGVGVVTERGVQDHPSILASRTATAAHLRHTSASAYHLRTAPIGGVDPPPTPADTASDDTDHNHPQTHRAAHYTTGTADD